MPPSSLLNLFKPFIPRYRSFLSIICCMRHPGTYFLVMVIWALTSSGVLHAVSRNAVKCRRSEWECSGHVQNVISLQRWVNKVFWLLPRGIDCVGNVCLSYLLSSLFFLPHSLQGTILSTFPVFSLHANNEENGW